MTSLRWNLSWLSSTPPTEKKVTTMNNKIQFDIANCHRSASSIIDGWRRAARNQGWSEDDIEAVLAEAKSGDYDHLVQTIMGYSE